MNTYRKLGLMLFCSLLLLSGFKNRGYAQEIATPTLRLLIDNPTPQMDDIITLQVLLESVPAIYGADVQLTFDPATWQVIDEDVATEGVQPAQGDFIEAEKAFILQHQADNETGIIDYALTLLNPAPPVEGDGLLLEVQLKAINEAISQITVTEAALGTQAGDTIPLNTENLEITVGPTSLERAESPLNSPEPNQALALGTGDWRNWLIAFLFGILLVLGIRQLKSRRVR